MNISSRASRGINAARRSIAPSGASAGAVSSKMQSGDELPTLPTAKEGWLWKRGGSYGGRNNWKRRWFVLLGDALYYMESRSDRTPRGRVTLTGCDFRIVEDECKRAHAFGIYHLTDMRIVPFFCAGDSADESQEWLDALRQASLGVFNLPHAEAGEANVALQYIAQLVREHEPRRIAQAQLEVTVVEARDLAAMDSNGLSDPYCVLHCGTLRCKTRVRPKTLNPKWNETFTFSVARDSSSHVQIDLFDKDVFSDDDFLGTLRLRVEELLVEGESRELDGWHELLPRTAKDAKVTGQLRLRTVVIPLAAGDDDPTSLREADRGRGWSLDDDESLPPETLVVQQVGSALRHLQHLYETAQQTSSRVAEEHTRLRAGLRDLISQPELAALRARASRLCVLRIRMLEARGVEARRGGGLGGLRCVLQCGETAVERTPIVRGSAAPRWEHLDLAFPVETLMDELVISLVDASGGAHSRRASRAHADNLGRIKLKIMDLIEAPASAHSGRHSIADGPGAGNAGGGMGAGAAAGSHDSWHVVAQHRGRKASVSHLGKSALAALGGASMTRGEGGAGGEGGGELALRVVCEWHYVARRTLSASGDHHSATDAEERGSDGGDESEQLLRDTSGILEGMRARMSAEHEHVEALHAHFHHLKAEFAHEYNAYCARKLGVLQVTVMSAHELPHHHAWNTGRDGAPPDSYVQLACGMQSASTAVCRKSTAPEFSESFTFDVTEETAELVLSARVHGVKARGGELGSVRVPIAPLRDQQPRLKREALVLPPSSGGAPPHSPSAKLGRLDSTKSDGGSASGKGSVPMLRFEVRFRSTTLTDAGADGATDGADTARYARLLEMLREEEPWLALALCETCPIERADRLASALVALLTVPRLEEGGSGALAQTAQPTGVLLTVLRVVLVTELEETYDEKLVLRRNSVATKLATSLVRAVGREYLIHTLREPIRAACEAAEAAASHNGDGATSAELCAFEVDPQKLGGGASDLSSESAQLEEQLARRRHALRVAACAVLDAILGSLADVPRAVRDVCSLIARLAEERFGEGTPASRDVVSGLLFLRVLVPCIASPSYFGILATPPSRAASRGLTLVSKVVNAVANGVPFGQKEPYMRALNDLVDARQHATDDFLQALANDDPHAVLSDEGSFDADAPLGAAELQALREMHKLLSATADKIYEGAPTPMALRALQEVLTDLGPADATPDGSGGDGASIAADWSPETVVARVVAVKEALLHIAARHGSDEADGLHRGTDHPASSPPRKSVAGQAPTAAAAGSQLISRFKQGLKRQSHVVPPTQVPDAGAEAALLATSAMHASGLSQTLRERRAKGRGSGGDDSARSSGGDSTRYRAIDEEEDEEEGAAVAAVSAAAAAAAHEDREEARVSRVEAEELRQALQLAVRENEELRMRLRHAESALQSQTAEVL